MKTNNQLNVSTGRNLLVLIVLCVIQASCKKMVTIDPPITGLSADAVFNTNEQASSALTAIYKQMAEGSTSLSNGGQSIGVLAGLSADELDGYYSATNAALPFYKNALVSNNQHISSRWATFYRLIYYANAAIEALSDSTKSTISLRKQLLGEAKFTRAFIHFYLLNLWGDVPLVTTTLYTNNMLLPRSNSATVYQQIAADLISAKELLSSDYITPQGAITSERTRPNKWVATALLARTYLFMGRWADAEAQSTLLINNSSMFTLPSDLNQVFLKTSTEAIWQLQPVTANRNSFDADAFILTAAPSISSTRNLTMTTSLRNAFQIGDARATKWVGTFGTYAYPFKYKIRGTVSSPPAEYIMVFRLAEQYLIRAEARAQQNKLTEAVTDLNVIRGRASLAPLVTTLTQVQILSAVEQERRVELFTEWGHRWMDLKRTGRIDAVMANAAVAKGVTWNTNFKLYPILLSELDKNPNMQQNPGY